MTAATAALRWNPSVDSGLTCLESRSIVYYRGLGTRMITCMHYSIGGSL